MAAGCCGSLAPVILMTIAAASIIYFSIPTHRITDLYVPALDSHNRRTESTGNTSVFIDLETEFLSLARYRADFKVTLFYSKDRSLVLGDHAVRGLVVDRRRVSLKAAVEARALPWEEALREVSGGSTVALVVELAMVARLEECNFMNKKCRWSSNESTEVHSAQVQVDASGHNVPKKPIKLLPRQKCFVRNSP